MEFTECITTEQQQSDYQLYTLVNCWLIADKKDDATCTDDIYLYDLASAVAAGAILFYIFGIYIYILFLYIFFLMFLKYYYF